MSSLPDEHINSYTERFGDGPSFTDMADKVVTLEGKLRKAHGGRTANQIAKDVMESFYFVAEREPWCDAIPDGFFDEVTAVVNRTFEVDDYADILTIKGERDLLARQRDKMIKLIEDTEFRRYHNANGVVVLAAMEVDPDRLLAVYLTDPADDDV